MLVGYALNDNMDQSREYGGRWSPAGTFLALLEHRTARLTILIDPRKKEFFERLCAEEDAVPSQVVRRLIRRYIEERTGRPWVPPAGSQHSGRKSRDRHGGRK